MTTPAVQTCDCENSFHATTGNNNALMVEGIHLRDSGAQLGEALDCALLTFVDLNNTHPLSINRLCNAYALSTAEAAVCKLMAEGWNKNEIADKRNVSPETIKSQIASVYRKTNSRNRADHIRLIIKTTPPVAAID